MSESVTWLPASRRPGIVAMIHVPALPGTPYSSASPAEILDRVAEEAHILDAGGVDAIIIENMHDRPYLLRETGPEIVAMMTAVGVAVKRTTDLPLGVQVLAGANREALAVALAVGAAFVRVEGFVFAHVADEGAMTTADAGPLLRYRKAIGAEHVQVLADIKKKHSSHAITADVTLGETAKAAEFFGADGVIVTGKSTAMPTEVGDLREVRAAVGCMVFVGSGTTPENLAEQWPHVDGFIIGSYYKKDGHWSNPPDPDRLDMFMDEVARLRG